MAFSPKIITSTTGMKLRSGNVHLTSPKAHVVENGSTQYPRHRHDVVSPNTLDTSSPLSGANVNINTRVPFAKFDSNSTLHSPRGTATRKVSDIMKAGALSIDDLDSSPPPSPPPDIEDESHKHPVHRRSGFSFVIINIICV